MDGGILLTIMGSNLGVKSEDIEEILVAGVACTFRPNMYAVSTRYIFSTNDLYSFFRWQ